MPLVPFPLTLYLFLLARYFVAADDGISRRFNDVVEAAEQYVRSDERRSEECNAGRGPRVMAAFCDGSSIM